jgi:hypothetical protein
MFVYKGNTGIHKDLAWAEIYRFDRFSDQTIQNNFSRSVDVYKWVFVVAGYLSLKLQRWRRILQPRHVLLLPRHVETTPKYQNFKLFFLFITKVGSSSTLPVAAGVT